MKLILPSHAVPNPRHPISANVHQFYSHKALSGQNAVTSDIVAELQAAPCIEVVRCLCSLSKALLSEQGMSPGFQLQLARDLLPAEWVETLQTMMRNDGADAGVVFHRRGVWFVLQMAALSCRESAAGLFNEELWRKVGRACLMANDVIAAVEEPGQTDLPTGDPAAWIAAVMVPMFWIDHTRPDFDLIGRSQLLWETAASSSEFQRELSRRSRADLDSTFQATYGIPLPEFLRFLWALYVKLIGNQLEPNLNPLRLDMATADVAVAFDTEFRDKALALISQSPEELAIQLLRTRQSWVYDVAPIRERPLLRIGTTQYCCPDATLFIRACVDRVYFLLQDAYGKDDFRELFGALFESYLNELVNAFAATTGPCRTYLRSPKFLSTQDQVADGAFLWTNVAALMEFKAGMLSAHLRYGAGAAGVLKGIEDLLGRDRKGVGQLARNLKRIIDGESRITSSGDTFELATCRRLYPILVCYDESLGFHAVRTVLQRRFDEVLTASGICSPRIGPLMVLSMRDFEDLCTAAQSVSVEAVLDEYAHHLANQSNDHTGSFS
jgi:hypothetical protein